MQILGCYTYSATRVLWNDGCNSTIIDTYVFFLFASIIVYTSY
jgi:hypothetical protein